MGFHQYHEPPEELSAQTRTLARMFASLTEEIEAINWYEQRISVEQDAEAKAIMQNAQNEELHNCHHLSFYIYELQTTQNVSSQRKGDRHLLHL